jgi:hypothetical protein
MAVDPREVEEMARIRRILNGEYQEEVQEVARNHVRQVNEHHDAADINSNDPKEQMKAILQRFNQGASNSVQRIQEDTSTHPAFESALKTEVIPGGVKIGSWEIRVYEDAGNKTYDVCHVQTSEPIARDLTLYESAVAITKLLNKHVSINSAQVREVLELEENYSRARTDAALFKRKARRMNESANEFEAHVADARYQEARATAIKFRDKLKSLNNSI